MQEKRKRFIKDGKVAVLVSPGFGAGWSTWNTSGDESLLFDPEIVQAVLDGDRSKAVEIATRKYPGGYYGGGGDLVVEWVDIGQRFEISEYDGSESLRLLSPSDGYVA